MLVEAISYSESKLAQTDANIFGIRICENSDKTEKNTRKFSTNTQSPHKNFHPVIHFLYRFAESLEPIHGDLGDKAGETLCFWGGLSIHS